MKKFLALYLLYLFGFFLLIDLEYLKELLRVEAIHTNSTILFSTYLIEAIGIEVIKVEGINIYLPSAILQVLFGCNGLEAIILYFAGILAYPDNSLERKANWFFWGYLALFSINIFRIALLAYIVEFHREHFEIFHTYITQGIMIFIAFGIFLGYLNSQKRGENFESS